MTTRYLICGGRDFENYALMEDALAKLILHPENALVIHGAARGADTLAHRWAQCHGAAVQAFPITPKDWDNYGKAAGPMRNRQMLMEGRPDVVIAFPGGRGTANMVQQADQLRKERNTHGGPPLIVITVTG